jgi:acetoin utilization deacetylase AcuC-like enzyme
VLYVSIHQWPLYPGTGAAEYAGEREGQGYTVNLPVPPGAGSEEFCALVEHVVGPIGRAYAPELIAISAGYDAHRDDPLASLTLETSSYGLLSSRMRALGEELGAPVGVLLEGGYDLRALAESVPETMTALAGGTEPPEAARHPLADQAAEVLGRYWEL